MKSLTLPANHRSALTRLLLLATITLGGAMTFRSFLAEELTARVGGGGSYGGGGGQWRQRRRWAIIGVARLLMWLTIEYPAVRCSIRSTDSPAVGIPDILFTALTRRVTRGSETFTSAPTIALGVNVVSRSPENLAREFEQLRKFDPNFSEIVFTDFCYALYGKAHDARGHGAERAGSIFAVS